MWCLKYEKEYTEQDDIMLILYKTLLCIFAAFSSFSKKQDIYLMFLNIYLHTFPPLGVELLSKPGSHFLFCITHNNVVTTTQ